jgi:hypothetical protein
VAVHHADVNMNSLADDRAVEPLSGDAVPNGIPGRGSGVGPV